MRTLLLIVAALASADVFAQTNLLVEGFNSTSMPPDWATEIVASGSPDPQLSFVTNSTYPPLLTPPEGPHFVCFNGHATSKGASLRLAHIAGISTWSSVDVDVSFQWAEDSGFS